MSIPSSVTTELIWLAALMINIDDEQQYWWVEYEQCWSTEMMGRNWWAEMSSRLMTIRDWHQACKYRLALEDWTPQPFLVGAKRTRLGLVTELVLFLSVGVDCNWEYCSIPCTKNKDQNYIYFCVSFDVMFMLMTHDWFSWLCNWWNNDWYTLIE